MYCRMIRGVYLRADGELACYCGPGENIIMGKVPTGHDNFDFVDDFYHNKSHSFVRARMSADRLPYPATCLKCIYLDTERASGVEALDKEIEWLHVEATSICNLNCPFCIPVAERKSYRPEPHYLPSVTFRKIVDNVAAHGLKIKWGYFSGRGEAGLHPEVWEMTAYIKQRLGTNFMVNTAGNIPYSDLIVSSGIDKIKIAIDGTDQASYETYRRGGRLEKVLTLTKKIADRKRVTGSVTPKIVWQYILFSHNDSQEEMVKLQELALAHDVDQLLFKSTITRSLSAQDPTKAPRIHPDIAFLDNRKMTDAPLADVEEACEQMQTLLREDRHADTALAGIKILHRITQRLAWGSERKLTYNTEDADAALARMSRDGEAARARSLCDYRRKALAAVVSAYEVIDPEEALRYRELSARDHAPVDSMGARHAKR